MSESFKFLSFLISAKLLRKNEFFQSDFFTVLDSRGDHRDIPRAKKSKYVPVVLSRDEVQEVLARLGQPYQPIAKLQYGRGLRCLEVVKVRVKDFNFDAGLLTVKGKSGKSRVVPLPNRIVPESLARLAFVKKVHA